MVFCSAILCGCEKDEQTKYKNSIELEKELSLLNSNLSANITADTKGFWSGLGKVCAVAGADIIGAYEGAQVGGKIGAAVGTLAGGHAVGGAAVGAAVGGAICGGGASYAAYRGVKSGCPYPTGYNSAPLSKFANDNICGKYHNAYLDVLFFSFGDPDYNAMYSDMFSDVIELKSYNSIINSIGSSSTSCAEVFSIVEEYISNEYNYDILISKFKKTFGFTDNVAKYFSCFFDIYSKSAKIENAFSIIDAYIEFLSTEGKLYFNEKELQALNCAMNVALFSTDYWSFLEK